MRRAARPARSAVAPAVTVELRDSTGTVVGQPLVMDGSLIMTMTVRGQVPTGQRQP